MITVDHPVLRPFSFQRDSRSGGSRLCSYHCFKEGLGATQADPAQSPGRLSLCSLRPCRAPAPKEEVRLGRIGRFRRTAPSSFGSRAEEPDPVGHGASGRASGRPSHPAPSGGSVVPLRKRSDLRIAVQLRVTRRGRPARARAARAVRSRVAQDLPDEPDDDEDRQERRAASSMRPMAVARNPSSLCPFAWLRLRLRLRQPGE